MAKINRFNGNLEAPASAALGTERTIFGTAGQSDELTDQFTAAMLRGWGIVGPSDQPTLQDFNAMGFTLGQIHAYLHQMGVPEYNAAQEYHIGSFANVAGVLYVSLVNDNVGNAPASSPAQWRLDGGVGYGQTWQSVVRAVSTAYTNTTGRPIQVNIRVASSVTQVWSLAIDGVNVQSLSNDGIDGTFFAIIPPGAIYTLTGGTVVNTWVELR